MKTSMSVGVREDERDKRFSGEIQISGTKFLCSLEISVPIGEYETQLRGKTIAQFREVIDIRIRRDAGAEISLENDEFNLFYYLLMPEVIRVHRIRLATGLNPGAVASMGGRDILLKPEAIHILTRPKFGCRLVGHTLSQRPN